MIKNVLLMVAVLLLLTLAIPSVYSLGLAPATKTIDSNETSYNLRIINNENKNLTVNITFIGPYSKYLSVPNNTITFSEEESSKVIRVSIAIPENKYLFENTYNQIHITEITDEEGTITSKLTIVHDLYINNLNEPFVKIEQTNKYFSNINYALEEIEENQTLIILQNINIDTLEITKNNIEITSENTNTIQGENIIINSENISLNNLEFNSNITLNINNSNISNNVFLKEFIINNSNENIITNNTITNLKIKENIENNTIINNTINSIYSTNNIDLSQNYFNTNQRAEILNKITENILFEPYCLNPNCDILSIDKSLSFEENAEINFSKYINENHTFLINLNISLTSNNISKTIIIPTNTKIINYQDNITLINFNTTNNTYKTTVDDLYFEDNITIIYNTEIDNEFSLNSTNTSCLFFNGECNISTNTLKKELILQNNTIEEPLVENQINNPPPRITSSFSAPQINQNRAQINQNRAQISINITTNNNTVDEQNDAEIENKEFIDEVKFNQTIETTNILTTNNTTITSNQTNNTQQEILPITGLVTQTQPNLDNKFTQFFRRIISIILKIS